MAVMTKERTTAAPSMQALREHLAKLTRELERIETEVVQAEAARQRAYEAHEEAQVGEVTGTHSPQQVTEAHEQLERREVQLRALRERHVVLTEGRARLDGHSFQIESDDILAQTTKLALPLRTHIKRLGQALAAAEAVYLEAEPVADRIQQLIGKHVVLERRLQRQGGQTGALPISSAICGLALRWQSLFHELYTNKSRLDEWRADCDRLGIEL